MLRANDLCVLNRTFLEGLRRADQEIREEIDGSRWVNIMGLIGVLDSSFKPADNGRPRRFVRFVIMVRSDVPNPKLAIASV